MILMEEQLKNEKQEKTKEQPKSVLEETKELLESIRKEKEELTKIRDDLNQLRSDQLLSGTAGGHIEAKPAKEETAKEYAQKVMSGGLNAKATEED